MPEPKWLRNGKEESDAFICCHCCHIYHWKNKTAIHDAIVGHKRRQFVLQKEDRVELTVYPENFLFHDVQKKAEESVKEKRRKKREKKRRAVGLAEEAPQSVEEMMKNEGEEKNEGKKE